MSNFIRNSVIKGSGFNPDGGGFSALTIDGDQYDANYVAEAVRAYSVPDIDGVAQDKVHRLKAYFWLREKTDQWVLALEGRIHDRFVNEFHTFPSSVDIHDVIKLPKEKEVFDGVDGSKFTDWIIRLQDLIERQARHIEKLTKAAATESDISSTMVAKVREVVDVYTNESTKNYANEIALLEETGSLLSESKKFISKVNSELIEHNVVVEHPLDVLAELDADFLDLPQPKAETDDCCGAGCCHHSDNDETVAKTEQPFVYDEFHRPNVNMKEAANDLLDDAIRYVSRKDSSGQVAFERFIGNDIQKLNDGNVDNLEDELLQHLTTGNDTPPVTSTDADSLLTSERNYVQFAGRVKRNTKPANSNGILVAVADGLDSLSADLSSLRKTTFDGVTVSAEQIKKAAEWTYAGKTPDITSLMSRDEIDAYAQYMQAEIDAYADKYGINPASINGWKPRKPIDQWLIEKRGLDIG